MTTLDLLQEENLIENSFKMGEIFRKELEDKLNKKIAISIRGKGLFNAVLINRSMAE